AITLEEGDELGWVHLTSGKDELILVTAKGQALRFKEEEVRPMGRQAAGVIAIKLQAGDRVASMDVVHPNADLLIVTEQGYGKRTALKDFPRHSRAKSGVAALPATSLKTS